MGLLQSLFGYSKEAIWSQFAEQVNGKFVDGGFWSTDKVIAKAGQWTVTLDTYDTGGRSSSTYTRLRAPYRNADNFYFRVYRANVFSQLGEMLGMKDIAIGDGIFDAEYVVKSNDEEKVRKLLVGPVANTLLHTDYGVSFEIKDDEGYFSDLPKGTHELYFQQSGMISDLNQLRALFDMFSLTLNRLCHLGSAYEDDPHFQY